MSSSSRYLALGPCKGWYYWAIVLAALSTTADVVAQDVLVFTDREHPIEVPTGGRVFVLDAGPQIESALAADLPSDPLQAAAIVRNRLKNGGAALERRLAAAYQAAADAWSLGVTKIPAVVVDRRYVVYGGTDVAAALERIRAYRSNER